MARFWSEIVSSTPSRPNPHFLILRLCRISKIAGQYKTRYRKQREILYNRQNPKLSKLQRKSFVIFQDPENPKFGTKKTKSQKQRKSYLNGFSKKRGTAKNRRCPNPWERPATFTPTTRHFSITPPTYLKP